MLVSLLFDVDFAAARSPLSAVVALSIHCPRVLINPIRSCSRRPRLMGPVCDQPGLCATPDDEASSMLVTHLPDNIPYNVEAVRFPIPIPYSAVHISCFHVGGALRTTRKTWLIELILWYLDTKTTVRRT